MGKGGYLGGGTIVGPMARWSDHADFPVPKLPPAEPTHDMQRTAAGSRTTRNQRKRRARQRYDAAVNTPAVKRQAAKPLDAGAQRRIDTHRLLIARLAGQIVQARRELERERAQLRALLQAPGLPTTELDSKDKT